MHNLRSIAFDITKLALFFVKQKWKIEAYYTAKKAKKLSEAVNTLTKHTDL